MASKEGTWQTWAGSRSDVSRAVREASDALREWSGYPSDVSARVTFADDVTESLIGAEALDEIYGSDVPDIRSLWIEVRPDREAYDAERDRLRDEYLAEAQRRRDQHRAAQDRLNEIWHERMRERIARGDDPGQPEKAEEPDEPELVPPRPLLSASVLIRIPWGGGGLRIEVNAPDRHQVIGLFDRLSDVLTRRQAFRRLDPDFVAWGLFVPLVIAGLILGDALPETVGLADRRGVWEAADFVGVVVGPGVAVLACVGFRWLYPTFEILDGNDKTRAERFAKFFWGMVTAVAAGLIAAGIWAIAG